MIEAIGIQKKYGELEVLKGIDLVIPSAEVVSIVGASGAGKTTLLQILGTLDLPDQGSLKYDGQAIEKLSSKALAKFRNQNIGFIFQFHHLLPEFTALENVGMPAYINNVARKEANIRATELLDFLGLKDRMDHTPSELSGGEQQRVAVARSLMNQPKVVFADEPSGNLDSHNALELHKLFFKLRDEFEQTFVIVTHNEELADMADRKLVMSDGRLV
ncbi:MAG: lipoprotein-releasing system ATP-binding protein [Flavobacteriales bacterium]|jgi:lipoprotein-releasing system ATP-binding protein